MSGNVYEDRIIEAMDGIITRLGSAEGFVLEQAPLVLREALVLERVTMTTAFVVLVAVTIALWFAALAGYRASKKPENEYCEGPLVVTIACPILSVVAIGLGTASAYYAAIAWFAPRVFMLEWATEQLSRLT